VLAAQKPAQPSAPTSIRLGDNVVFSWDLSDNGGSVIDKYLIEIQEENGLTYSVDASCNGELAAVRDFRTCSVPITTLMAIPFTLPWGKAVVARVSAHNFYGWSTESLPTASDKQAIILRKPDAPISLVNDLLVTFGTSIGLTWTPGPQNGGTVVKNYTLWSD
jgi:hypothetical protein